MAKEQLPKYGREILGLSPDGSAPESVLDMLNIGKPSKRRSDWNKRHAPKAFAIPAPLIETAKEVRETVLSCGEFDERDKPRASPLTADVAATCMLEWAIKQVEKKPGLLPVSQTPHSKTGWTAYTAEWNTWAIPPSFPKPTRRKKATKKRGKYVLSYRIPNSQEKAIRDISERTGVPLGEVLLRLIQIGIEGYKAMKYRIVPTAKITYTDAKIEEA